MTHTTTPLRVAVLDDDADFREFLAGTLEALGHQANTFEAPEALYAHCENSTPEVVLLDMHMGRVRGEEVLAELRHRWPKLCVVVVTGYPSLDSMRSMFKQEAFDYLAKPFKTEQLEAILSQAATRFGLGASPQDRLRAELGRQIRVARTARSWTLKDMSESSGVSVSQLSSIERGAHLPSLESLLAVSEALGHRPSEWLIAAGF